jgi:hypothetical protein
MDDLDFVIARSYRVTCSCGKTSAVVWSYIRGDYESLDESWTFGSNYWTCGTPGHWQKSFTVLVEERCE